MRTLLTSAPLHGHLMQLVPLAWALRSAGHEVLVATPANLVAVALAAGLPAVPVSDEVSMGDMIAYDRTGAAVGWPSDPEAKIERSGRGFARLAARTLPGTRSLVRSWRPDLLVCEPTEYSGPLAAAEAGLPWVEHWWGLAVAEGYRRAATSELAAELDELGRDDLPTRDMVIDVCPPSLQGPLTGSRQLMRYLPYNGTITVPDWVYAERSRPRICVTLGSVLPRFFGNLLTRAVSALDELDVEIVLAAGPDAVAALGPLPPSVRAAGWLPLSVVLPGCDLSVHHGGPGSTLTSFVHRVPQLVLPGASDTVTYAQLVQACGAGEHLDPGELDATSFATVCRRLLDEPSYRQDSAAVADEIAAMPAPAMVVPALECLAIAGQPAFL